MSKILPLLESQWPKPVPLASVLVPGKLMLLILDA